MRLLITGACGFVGSRLASSLKSLMGAEITGFDNLIRPGSELNRAVLRDQGIHLFHGDIRSRSDVEQIPACDWVIDAAANPSVLAGVDGRSSSRQLWEHNLGGTLNLLEYCRQHRAGLVLLSTSRVYSVEQLASLPMKTSHDAFQLDARKALPSGVSPSGVSESFSVAPPISLYGATKLCSEQMALEYGATFGFPVWINRCGVLAGAGQFGTAEQGIFSYWLHAHAARLPLRYIGFGGDGFQVRDAFHPDDLAALLKTQLQNPRSERRIFNVSGGQQNSMSLSQLTAWCNDRFGRHDPQPDTRPRPFDIPWLVLDSSEVRNALGWEPKRSLLSILDEIAVHVHANPNWLKRTGAI